VTDDGSDDPQHLPDRTAAELARLTADFPSFDIWREVTGDNRARFVARGRSADIHPRIVVTPDAAELRAALSGELRQR
jgi:hypothetical protein